jgi:hypothetical protein
MNALLYGNSLSTFMDKGGSTLVLKTSGTTTPAPRTKVLRWKDLEAAAAEALKARDESDECSGRSVFGTVEGRVDVLSGNELWEEDGHDIEELFV